MSEIRGDTLPKIRLAAVQAASVFLDREESVAKACSLIREAGQNNADVIAFPEGFIPGHPVWFHFFPCTAPEVKKWNKQLFQNAVEVPSQAVRDLGQAAREAGACVVIGICEKEPEHIGTMFNTLLFFNREGELIGRHRKWMPTLGERIVHMAGSEDTLHAWRTDFGKMSGLICGENYNPLAVYTLLARGTSVHAASWPPCFAPGQDMSETVLIASRAFAFQAKAFVINAFGLFAENAGEMMAGTAADREFIRNPHSGSSIIGPTGKLLAGPMGAKEGILYADADLDELIIPKVTQDLAGHYNRADLFELHIKSRPFVRLFAGQETIKQSGQEVL